MEDDAKDGDAKDDDAKEQYIVKTHLSCLPFVKPVIAAAEGYQNRFVRNSSVHFATLKAIRIR